MSNAITLSCLLSIRQNPISIPDTLKVDICQILFEWKAQSSEQELPWDHRRFVISVFSPAEGLSALDKWGRSCGNSEARHLVFLFQA